MSVGQFIRSCFQEIIMVVNIIMKKSHIFHLIREQIDDVQVGK